MVTGDHGFVPTKSSRLYAIELKTGAIMGYLKFTQPLTVAPTIDRQKTRIYAPGDQSVLYTISLRLPLSKTTASKLVTFASWDSTTKVPSASN